MKTAKQAISETQDLIIEQFVPYMIGQGDDDKRAEVMKSVTDQVAEIMKDTDPEWVVKQAAMKTVLTYTTGIRQLVEVGRALGIDLDQIVADLKAGKQRAFRMTEREDNEISLSN